MPGVGSGDPFEMARLHIQGPGVLEQGQVAVAFEGSQV